MYNKDQLIAIIADDATSPTVRGLAAQALYDVGRLDGGAILFDTYKTASSEAVKKVVA